MTDDDKRVVNGMVDVGVYGQACGECHDVHRRSNSSCVGPFLGAGFLFGRSTLLTAAPPDRYLPLLFHGEELLLVRSTSRPAPPALEAFSHTISGSSPLDVGL